ncbi:MAG: hypothetical protein L0Z50_43210, partial [Verrucomicrobiales bacterium]|nr:hypothetical protein [Verrucomicrobiales bacterium]
VLQFAQPLAEALYTVKASSNITDLAGNRLKEEIAWHFGFRPLVTFVGTNDLWTSTPATARTNWSSGVLPRTNDFLDIALPEGHLLHVQRNVNAYQVLARNPVAFEGSPNQSSAVNLNLGGRAIFEKPVTIDGGVTWSGGESDILDQLHIGGPRNSFVLENHVLNNGGHVLMEKPVNTALRLVSEVGRVSGVRNLAGATWEHLDGIIFGMARTEFENRGLFIKRGIGDIRIEVDRFSNLGTVEVREGLLEIKGVASGDGIHQHFGTYRVDAGTRLALTSERSEYNRITRIFGDGNVELYGDDTEQELGSIAVNGAVTIPFGQLNFSQVIDCGGPLRLTGKSTVRTVARLSARDARIAGGIHVDQGACTLIVNTPTPLALSSLTVLDSLMVDTALEVNGPLVFGILGPSSARLLGAGRLRATGPVIFNGLKGDSSQTPGRFELAGVAACGNGNNAVAVNVDNYNLSILPGGVLNLGAASEFNFGRAPIENQGSIVKTSPAITRLSGIHNRGLVQVEGGKLYCTGSFVQTEGSTTFSGTDTDLNIVAGASGSGALEIQRGRFQSGLRVRCNDLNNAAVLSPGAPIGISYFSVSTDFRFPFVYTQTASGTLVIDMAGTEAGVTYDQLNVMGEVSLDGALEVALAAGYDPPLGQEFSILAGQTVTGTFAEVRGAALPGGKRLEPVYEATRVKLRVVAGP